MKRQTLYAIRDLTVKQQRKPYASNCQSPLIADPTLACSVPWSNLHAAY